jgi:hypothetical protein
VVGLAIDEDFAAEGHLTGGDRFALHPLAFPAR